MTTWIFQGNPETFDIDGYLQASNGEILWLVTKYADQLEIGDKVYIWRALGKSKSADQSGIIAEAQIIDSARSIPDEPSALPFWKGDYDGTLPRMRARLRLIKLANKKGILKREWLKEDSALDSLSILKQPAGTNFKVTASQEARLSELWSKTGKDWTEAEVIAALALYGTLKDKPISKAKGSPVENLSQRIGRATSAVYNKLLNFRAIDPRDKREGLSGGSKTDKAMWDRYYDTSTGQLKHELEHDSNRLWNKDNLPTPLPVEEDIESEIQRLTQRSLEELRDAHKRSPKAPVKMQRVAKYTYTRDPRVVAITLLRASFKCEVDGCTSPIIERVDGGAIMEVHHLKRLADGGIDDPANTVCVCPNHHRALHYGKHADDIRETLIHLRLRMP